MIKYLPLTIASGLIGILGCSGVEEFRPAKITCQPYTGCKIEQTALLGKDWHSCPSETDKPHKITVDTVCIAESNRGTAIGYLDSRISWQGYCNPPARPSGNLPNGVKDKEVMLPIFKEGYGPCYPVPTGIGLSRYDGWLVKYGFEREKN